MTEIYLNFNWNDGSSTRKIEYLNKYFFWFRYDIEKQKVILQDIILYYKNIQYSALKEQR